MLAESDDDRLFLGRQHRRTGCFGAHRASSPSRRGLLPLTQFFNRTASFGARPKHKAADVARAQAIPSKSELLRAMFDGGQPNTPHDD